MNLRDDEEVYSVTVEDIRRVVEEEGHAPLTDEQLNRVADEFAELLPWYDTIIMALQNCFPDSGANDQDKD